MAEHLLAERLLSERVLRELPELRAMSKAQALYWLRSLMIDIRRAEEDAILNARRIARLREEAVLAMGLIGIELDGRYRQQRELDDLWDGAIGRVKAWREAIDD